MPENFALILGALVNAQPNKTLTVSRADLEDFNPQDVMIAMAFDPDTLDVIVTLSKVN